ncbi:MAG: DUF29 family protein [Nostoc sp. CreGUA01]|nr:DUF29 family protein [Nostoc sp. CreGUA01]
MKPYLDEVFLTVYELGLALAIRETELNENVFPEICPYTLDETLNPKFLPNPNQVNLKPGRIEFAATQTKSACAD